MQWQGWLEEPVRPSSLKHNCDLFSEGCFPSFSPDSQSQLSRWVAALKLGRGGRDRYKGQRLKVAFLIHLCNLTQALTRLKRLALDNNLLSSVPALPPSVEVLKMNHNELSTLSPQCFKGKAPLLCDEQRCGVLAVTGVCL